MIKAGRVNHATKLTPEDVEKMRVRRFHGASQKDLARDFNITDGQVSMIVRGLRWRDAGGPIETERRYRRA